MNTLDHLENLDRKATNGPWEWTWEDKSVMALYGKRGLEDHVLWAQVCKACQERGGRCTAPDDRNADLIAAMRNALPKLLHALRLAVAQEATKTATEYLAINKEFRAALAELTADSEP